MDSLFCNLRGVRWRIHLGILPRPPSSVDDLRRAAADSRRRYQMLRRSLLVDLSFSLEEGRPSDLEMDNPLSQSPGSIWGRFFQNAELVKILDQDLSRLYLGDGSFFQEPSCQSMLRRILMLWSLEHPDYGYRQGMHELLAPLLYVLHIDLQNLSKMQGMYKVYFDDDFDGMWVSKYGFISKDKFISIPNDRKNDKVEILHDVDPETMHIFLLNDAYGTEGELGIIFSERFIEHDAYCMFESLMNDSGGVPAMADFFSSRPAAASALGLTPVLEASFALFNLLFIVDPSLHNHFVELGVEPQYFALRWLRVLFGREFSLDDLLAIWDEILSCPSNISTHCIDNKMELHCRSLCSERGAFITAFAISMLLNLRSTLLATDNATTCLQRLLNFPANIDVRILIGKAKSLHALALDAIMTFDSTKSKHNTRRRHSISFCSASPQTPTYDLRESYWEEQWKLMHSKNKFHQVNPGEIISGETEIASRKKPGLFRAKSELPSTESLTGVKDALYSARRKLLKNFSQGRDFHVAMNESINDDQDVALSNLISLSTGLHDSLEEQPNELIMCTAEDTCSREDEQVRMVYDQNNSEESSLTSSSYVVDNNDDVTRVEVESYSDIDFNKGMLQESEQTYDTGRKGSSLKEQKNPGRVQWSRGLSNVSVKRQLQEEKKVKFSGTSHKGDNLEDIKDPFIIFGKLETEDKKLMDTLRTLGQSMLENIQVIESTLQQDCKEASASNNSSGNEKATVALSELRNISKLLCGYHSVL